MKHRVFLAGASGAIGRRLVVLLRNAGHHVTGTTRSRDKADALRRVGIEPVVVDAFDADALMRATESSRPDIVIHQLTDLPRGLDPGRMAEAIARNARLRREGTANLVRAALAAGARRLIAQSIAWAYAPGPEPHVESDPLDIDAQGVRAISVGGIVALETQVLDAPIESVVLRYGQLYGPGTGNDAPSGVSPLHVDAAADAAVRALDLGRGVFNIAEPNAYAATGKAGAVLGWQAGFRLPG